MAARIALESGLVLTGRAIGAPVPAGGEVVFHTGMTGYQEILTDPSYAGQIVVFTAPHIGNYGIHAGDFESARVRPAAIVVRDFCRRSFHRRSENDLDSLLRRAGIPALTDVDTRALTIAIRDGGTCRATIGDDPADAMIARARALPTMQDEDWVARVSTPEAYEFPEQPDVEEPFEVAVLDCGVKKSILRRLVMEGCRVRVFPHDTPAMTLLRGPTEGVFLSNGPGDPATRPDLVEKIRKMVRADVPIFGICLGHQLLARALGAETIKLPFGHHGANHPVQNLATQRVEITSQNHNYAVPDGSLDPAVARVTHLSLNDRSIEGLETVSGAAYSVQYHPEAAPGPSDSLYLFRRFRETMLARRSAKEAAMPRRTDLRTILVLGSGPIVIGQASEFDYSGSQAVKALRREGYRVVLVNSNPATIMTDPGLADATYIEPLTWQTAEQIIAREKPDAVLPTVGGQTGLNLAVDLVEHGVLERHGVELIGASVDSIRLAEDRELFKEAMKGIGLDVARSLLLTSLDQAEQAMAEIPFPMILRASFTLGGAGSGNASTREEFIELLRDGLAQSPVGSVLVEESVLGWKEYELEVVRDRAGNGIIVCSIENFDAMGVHTGDSVTVAPAQTLTDREYQTLRDQALQVLDAVGVATGGSNVQFAVDPESGRVLVIEMNPRVSRSSALASKATGYPIAKIAALLAVGYTLPELPNEITGTSSACFEPSIDYAVVKVPRWSFEKFPGTPDLLGTTMQSVGEVMGIGRTFREALQKALRSLDVRLDGWESRASGRTIEELEADLRRPRPSRLSDLHEAFRRGLDAERLHRLTGIDPWFLDNLARLMEVEGRLRGYTLSELPRDLLREAKREGFSDRRISRLVQGGAQTSEVRERRLAVGLAPVFRRVDTCAAEFGAEVPYLYSTWEDGPCEARPTDKKKVIVLGGGPNRIGQGIEFDTCCCHAVEALRAEGVEAILVNCNPETVSTDYDLSDRLYFEPLYDEEVLHVIDREQPEGVIVTLGGQTPLNLARFLEKAGAPILGTGTEPIDRAEDRDRCGRLLDDLKIDYPAAGSALTLDEARTVAARIGYPVIVRPSYVLGGRAMGVVYDEDGLEGFFAQAAEASGEHPVLIDQFLEGAVEFDVDAVCDGRDVLIGGILQHIEEAGIHSGDSFAVLPPPTATAAELQTIREHTRRIALELGVIGLMNIQFASLAGKVFVLEINPRASRTVPFLEKATGVELAGIATRCMLGQSLAQQGAVEQPARGRVYVKGPVFPFRRFPRTDHILGPEMKSTGEVMGIGETFGEAFAKANLAAGQGLPTSGTVFLSVKQADKAALLPIARSLKDLGFELQATDGTARFLEQGGVPARVVCKVGEGQPDIGEIIRAGGVQMVINTPLGQTSRYDEGAIRREARAREIPCITTIAGARAAVDGIRALQRGGCRVDPIQELPGAAAAG